ncbi:MAG: hypothetical protein ACOYD6_09440 [Limnochordia bacterium]|jgi:hypothetical protein
MRKKDFYEQAEELGAYGQEGRQLMGQLGQRRSPASLAKKPAQAHLAHSPDETLGPIRDEDSSRQG